MTEAPEVVSNLPQGDEGGETPPPNDSLASISPPVGGRLCSFRRDWQTEKCSNMLNFISNGLCVSQQSTTSQPPRLVSRIGQLQEQGFSVEVAERNAARQRSSTRTIYKDKVGPV